jgi:hypothetical protein
LRGHSFSRISRFAITAALKGHGFSRAGKAVEEDAALAAGGMPVVKSKLSPC